MQIACQSEFFLKWFIHLLCDEPARRATVPGRGPCPNVGITATAGPVHDDHRSPNRKQRFSLRQVEIPMSQKGKMCFVAAGVIMGSDRSQTAAMRASVRPRRMVLHLDERRVDGQPVKVRLNENQHHD